MFSIASIAESTFGAGEKHERKTVLIYFGVPYALTERETRPDIAYPEITAAILSHKV